MSMTNFLLSSGSRVTLMTMCQTGLQPLITFLFTLQSHLPYRSLQAAHTTILCYPIQLKSGCNSGSVLVFKGPLLWHLLCLTTCLHQLSQIWPFVHGMGTEYSLYQSFMLELARSRSLALSLTAPSLPCHLPSELWLEQFYLHSQKASRMPIFSISLLLYFLYSLYGCCVQVNVSTYNMKVLNPYESH